MLEEFTEAQKTQNEKASYGLYGAQKTGVSSADIQTGFVSVEMNVDADEEGNTKNGSIFEREGFLSPLGYNTR